MVNFNLTSFPYMVSSSIIPNEVKNSFLNLQWLNGTQGNISFKCFILFPNAFLQSGTHTRPTENPQMRLWLVRLHDSLTCLLERLYTKQQPRVDVASLPWDPCEQKQRTIYLGIFDGV